MLEPELVQVDTLRTLNLAVQGQRAQSTWPEFDVVFHQALLH
jgi:hypothetical protein